MAIIEGDPYLNMKFQEELLKEGYLVEGDQLVKLSSGKIQKPRIKRRKRKEEPKPCKD